MHTQAKQRQAQMLNEMEARNLLDIDFLKMGIRMLKKLSENYNSMKKDMETI